MEGFIVCCAPWPRSLTFFKCTLSGSTWPCLPPTCPALRGWDLAVQRWTSAYLRRLLPAVNWRVAVSANGDFDAVESIGPWLEAQPGRGSKAGSGDGSGGSGGSGNGGSGGGSGSSSSDGSCDSDRGSGGHGIGDDEDAAVAAVAPLDHEFVLARPAALLLSTAQFFESLKRRSESGNNGDFCDVDGGGPVGCTPKDPFVCVTDMILLVFSRERNVLKFQRARNLRAIADTRCWREVLKAAKQRTRAPCRFLTCATMSVLGTWSTLHWRASSARSSLRGSTPGASSATLARCSGGATRAAPGRGKRPRLRPRHVLVLRRRRHFGAALKGWPQRKP